VRIFPAVKHHQSQGKRFETSSTYPSIFSAVDRFSLEIVAKPFYYSITVSFFVSADSIQLS
jgi:hypothetical protein